MNSIEKLSTPTPITGHTRYDFIPLNDGPAVKSADRWLITGAVLLGSMIFSPIGLIVLIGWTFAFLYHLLNGVRHLAWDLGRGFERRERHLSGWLAVIGAAALTL